MNICALATGRGGAIAVIRVSGPDAITMVNKHFQPAKVGNSLTDAKGQSLHYGQFLAPRTDTDTPNNGEAGEGEWQSIDEVLVSIFRTPHSYTGENAAEIACHASTYITTAILQSLIGSGCRMAEPGEFTKRAFLNGKLDLSQAEAVADIIASTNAATHRIALSQLRGNFSNELADLREKLLHLTSLMELELDFSDHEELEFADRTELLSLTRTIADKVNRLAQSFKTGQALKNGIPVAIIGKTNVGKSTLLNRLLRDDRAIVSDIHGTTRDVIEDTINIRGIDFRFIDTAGLRDTTDEIERLGIERSYKKLDEATIVIWLTDEQPTPDEQHTMLERTTDKKLIIVRNKIDIQPDSTHNLQGKAGDTLFISAKENIGIDTLESTLIAAADIPEITENDVIVTSARHYDALIKAHDSLLRVLDGLSLSIPTDLIAEDLRMCLNTLGEITGAVSSQDVLENIWKNFCVGK